MIAARLAAVTGSLLLLACGEPATAREPLADDHPHWVEDDRAAIPVPEPHEPALLAYGIDANFSRPLSRLLDPGRWLRALFGADPAPPAADVNSLDEVMDSTWFTNRIGLYPMTEAEVMAGPGGEGPDCSGPWRVVQAKSAGVSLGFVIEDVQGTRFLMKFDEPLYPELSTRAAPVTSRLFHAIGYNVPQDHAVSFRREQLQVTPGLVLRARAGGEFELTETRLDSLLTAANAFRAGRYQALVSRFLDGEIIGPFDAMGTRSDDPNDRVAHQHRRSLRALRLFAAWTDHVDTKMHNSLDVYVGEPGEGHVVHHLIDFASTLGAQAGVYILRFGFEYVFDPGVFIGRTLGLGLRMPAWIQLRRPADLPEVGFWQVELWDPLAWKPTMPNSAFANLTDRDGYWAAKVISAFDDDHLRAAVAAGGYRQPEAAEYMVRILAARRDKLARAWFDRVAPIDFFRWTDDAVVFRDLGMERNLYPEVGTRYRVRWAAVDHRREERRWTPWQEQDGVRVPLGTGATAAALTDIDADHPYFAVSVQLDRGQGWSGTTTAYFVPATGRVVAVDR
ncbi:MAG: hypothetical protein R6X25_08075 [Candidatus Krumholzibacteriia bacterium]